MNLVSTMEVTGNLLCVCVCRRFGVDLSENGNRKRGQSKYKKSLSRNFEVQGRREIRW